MTVVSLNRGRIGNLWFLVGAMRKWPSLNCGIRDHVGFKFTGKTIYKSAQQYSLFSIDFCVVIWLFVSVGGSDVYAARHKHHMLLFSSF